MKNLDELELRFFLGTFVIESKLEKTPYLPSSSTAAKGYALQAFWGLQMEAMVVQGQLAALRRSEVDAEESMGVQMVCTPYVRHIQGMYMLQGVINAYLVLFRTASKCLTKIWMPARRLKRRNHA